MKWFLTLFLTFLMLHPFSLNGDNSQWTRAEAPHDWSFPRDHGAHKDYQTEWWYFTGHLKTTEGREFGYQLTFFRQGVQRDPAQKKSKWAFRDLAFAHASISDLKNAKFHFDERVTRGGPGGVEYSEEHMKIRVEDWEIVPLGDDHFELKAIAEGFTLHFTVEALKPKIFQGDRGLSVKGSESGNASHYYSYTRMKTEGKVVVGDEVIPVTGESWFDHEFSTSFLSKDQVGWDWFAIMLDNNEEMMAYYVRRRDGSNDSHSKGAYVDTKGERKLLKFGDYSIEPTGHWTSTDTGARYPSGWKISVPGRGLEITVTPKLKDQEMHPDGLGNMAYWEGACRVEGILNGKPITGKAYVELAGYLSAVSDGFKSGSNAGD